MIKKYLIDIILKLELYKIFFFKKLFGISYVSYSLTKCFKYNISHILRKYGAKIGVDNNFIEGIIVDNLYKNGSNIAFKNLIVGNNTYIGKGVFFDLAEQIVIEDSVVIGAKATFLTHWDVGNRAMSRYYKRKTGKIVIKNSSWIGANVTILQGVTIGEFAVVAAGSVVLEDVPPYSLYAGNPAKFKKKIK